MRHITLGLLALAACSSTQNGLPEEPVARTAAPIVYGSADAMHTAVVALLSPDGGGYDQCSGTIVQVSGGLGYVLTAAHCCSPAPTVVILHGDYGVGVPYLDGKSPVAPAYAVNAGSVKVDPAYVPTTAHDFCMLTFDAPADTPFIPVATGDDGLTVGTPVEYVGFGVVTDSLSDSNTLRNHATAPVDTEVTATTFTYDEGGGIGGPCEGDSGGPALLPVGAAQAAQTVVGTTSYGTSKCQPSGSTGVDMRVTSATGADGFISTYLGIAGGVSSSSSSGTGGGTTAATTGTGAGTTGTGTTSGNGGATTTTGAGGSLFGAGGGGTTGAGAGNSSPSGGAGSSGNSSGCTVASGTGNAPSAPGSLAGMLLGAAVVISRRRR
jgi:hypothetical protein